MVSFIEAALLLIAVVAAFIALVAVTSPDDSERGMFVAANNDFDYKIDDPDGCTCCAEVVSQSPLVLKARHKLEQIGEAVHGTAVVGCAECDEPMIALIRGGKQSA